MKIRYFAQKGFLLQDTSLTFLACTVSTVVFFASMVLSWNFHYVSTALLILSGLALFIFFAASKRSLFELRAIFSAAWFVSIGLACLRININQKPWILMTWVCLWLTYLCFIIGFLAYSKFFLFNMKVRKPIPAKKEILLRIPEQERTVFWGIIALFTVTFGSFIFEATKLKCVPIFSSDMNAYINFHIKGIHYLTVSSILVFPFSYYYIKTYSSPFLKRSLLIVLSVMASMVPLLIVSRQLFILEVVVGTLVVAAAGRKKEIVCLVFAGIIMVGGYCVLSLARNQNAQYLESVFNIVNVGSSQSRATQSETSLSSAPQSASNQESSSQSTTSRSVAIQSSTSTPLASVSSSNSLPMYLYQPYMYVTFNFDNFNYLVVNQKEYTYGKQILYPIICLSPLKFFFPSLADLNPYLINPYLNTYPICYGVYYDFGVSGLVIYFLLIGFVSCWVVSKEGKSIFSTISAAIIKYALLFSFFTNFFADPTIAFYFILILVSYICTTYRFRTKKSLSQTVS